MATAADSVFKMTIDGNAVATGDTMSVWINQNLQSTPFTPLAGAKQSGFGQENGVPGLLEFTRSKSIYIPKPKVAA